MEENKDEVRNLYLVVLITVTFNLTDVLATLCSIAGELTGLHAHVNNLICINLTLKLLSLIV